MKLPEDPFILVSYVNLKLRDDYETLDDLVEDLEICKEDLISKLNKAGFIYIEDIKQASAMVDKPQQRLQEAYDKVMNY